MHILAVFAHPDDEAYGPGATLARYAHTGHDVSLITLTHGEDGKLGICKTMKPDEIARMRSEELKCSAKTLGIDYLKIYHFPDRNLMKHPEQEGIEAVAQAIKKLKPDILLTFHPGGISGHSDHIAASDWCLNAVKSTSLPVRLVYYGIDKEQAENVRNQRQIIPFEDSEVTHIIDASEYFRIKKAAIHCHVSQLELWERFQAIEGGYEYFARAEHFAQVIPPLKSRQIFDDLESG